MKKSTQQKSDLEYRINRARLAGAMRNYPQTEFKNYLLDLGLNKYEKTILPVETEVDCPTTTNQGAKIIPFPGVTLNHEATFQNELDDFLREMGYIE
jgi:hypothetical protein